MARGRDTVRPIKGLMGLLQMRLLKGVVQVLVIVVVVLVVVGGVFVVEGRRALTMVWAIL